MTVTATQILNDPATTPGEITVRSVVIATVCMLGVSFGAGIAIGALGYVQIDVTREFGWSRTDFSIAATAFTWAGAVVAPIVGRLSDRFGVRPFVLGGTLFGGLLALAMSQQTASLPMLYLVYALLGVCATSAVGFSKVIAALFKRNRGKMLALFGIESTLGAAAIPLMMAVILSRYGWRSLYIVFGLLTLALLPLIYFLIEEPGGSSSSAKAPALEGMTISQILRSQPFWVMMVGSILVLGPSAGVVVHTVAYLRQKGFPYVVAGSYLSASLLVGIFGSAIGGWMMDRFPTAKIAAPFYALLAAGAGCIVLVTPSLGGLPLLYAAAALGGLAGATRPMNTYFHTRFFGLRAFNEVLSVERSILGLTTGLAVPLMGLLYDRTHSYDAAFVMLIVGSGLTVLAYLFIQPYRYSADLVVSEDPA